MSWSTVKFGQRKAVRKALETFIGHMPNDKSHIDDVRPLILGMVDHNGGAPYLEVSAGGHRNPDGTGETLHVNVKTYYEFLTTTE